MKKKAVGYIRVSEMGPKAKVDLKESPDTQLEYIKKYCEQKGYELVEIYQDLDYSGGSDKRPDFQRLFNDMEGKQKKFDVVVVYNLSRFARNLKDLLTYLDVMDRKEVEFASATEDFLRTDDYMGSFMINIIGSVAEFQRKQTAEAVRDNMLNIAKSKGRFLGGIAPLGYRIDPNTKEYIIEEEKATVVQLIFDMYLRGIGMDTITQHLITNRILGKDNWSKSSVRAILVNPIYTGSLYYNRRKNVGVDRKKWNVEDEWIVKSENHQQIISKKAFDKVQKIMGEKGKNSPLRNAHRGSKHLLSGLLVCGNCGNHFFGNAKVNGSGNRYEYYICSGKQRHSRAFCQAKGIRVDKVDPLILDTMDNVLNKDMLLQLFNHQFKELTKEGRQKFNQKLGLEKQKNKMEEQINKLLEKVLDAKTDKLAQLFENKIVELQEQVEELQIQIETFDEEDLLNIEGLESFRLMLIKSDKFELNTDFVKILNKELQRDIVGRFIDKILVEELEDGSSKLTVKYKIEMEDLQLVQKINRVKVNEDLDERREIFNKILNHIVHCGYDDYTGPPVS